MHPPGSEQLDEEDSNDNNDSLGDEEEIVVLPKTNQNKASTAPAKRPNGLRLIEAVGDIDSQVRAIRELIEEHGEDQLTVKQISRKLGRIADALAVRVIEIRDVASART